MSLELLIVFGILSFIAYGALAYWIGYITGIQVERIRSDK